MHFADSIVIFLLALVLFGPKKLPEIGRQIGKLLAEFRRASNEFKMQIDEELRAMEQQERQKKLEEAAAQKPSLPAPEAASDPSILPPESSTLSVSPPSTGETVSANAPYAPATPPELPEPSGTSTSSSSPEVNLNGYGSSQGASDAVPVNGVEHAPVHHG
jgi:sec-independent protein translocase protein TatB